MCGGTKGRRSIQARRMSEKRHLLQVHRRSSRTQSSTPQHVPVPYTTLVQSTTSLATSHYNEHNDRDGRIHDDSAPAEAGTEQGRADGCIVEGADSERPDPDGHVAGTAREADAGEDGQLRAQSGHDSEYAVDFWMTHASHGQSSSSSSSSSPSPGAGSAGGTSLPHSAGVR